MQERQKDKFEGEKGAYHHTMDVPVILKSYQSISFVSMTASVACIVPTLGRYAVQS